MVRLLVSVMLLRRVSCQQVFFNTTLAYEPAAVRMPSQLSVSLQVDSETRIRNPARVAFHLPGFVLPGAVDETQVELGGQDAFYFDPLAVWLPTSDYLVLHFGDTPVIDQTLSVFFVDPFELPETGLVKNDPSLKLALSRDRNDALDGLSWAAILRSPAVGSFYSEDSPTELTWRKDPTRQTLQAGQAVAVILHFYAHMALFKGDSITVTLPGTAPKEL